MVADMMRSGYAPGTANTRLSHLKVLLRYAKSLDLVDEDLEFPWVKKVDNQRDRFLTVEEEEKMLKLLNHRGLFEDAQLIETLIDTGCRPSELIRGESVGAPIKWTAGSKAAGGTAQDAYNPDTGQSRPVIYIKRTKTGAKGERALVLTDRATNAFLASKQRGDERPFGNRRVDDLSELVREVADHLGMPDVVLYTMRHTCASRLVQRGADLFRVSKWMGHTNVKTTQRYAHLVPNNLFELGDLL
jgi:integrase